VTDDASLMRKRLYWVEDLRKGLIFILGEEIMDTVQVHPTVDPLKVILKIPLRSSITQESREPFREYVRAWAEIGNCVVPRIDILGRYVQAEVLIKHRIWKEGMEDFGSKKRLFENKGWNRGLKTPRRK
jgi:hypothetical protein